MHGMPDRKSPVDRAARRRRKLGFARTAAGRLYVTSRRGVTTVFQLDPQKFMLLAMNDLGEPSNATPAISDGQIFLRTDSHLYCIADD